MPNTHAKMIEAKIALMTSPVKKITMFFFITSCFFDYVFILFATAKLLTIYQICKFFGNYFYQICNIFKGVPHDPSRAVRHGYSHSIIYFSNADEGSDNGSANVSKYVIPVKYTVILLVVKLLRHTDC